jgi:restriction system protein
LRNNGSAMMIEKTPTNVLAAFEILLEELETEIELINKDGSKAFANRDYDRARQALARADQATVFREQLSALRVEWEKLAPPPGGEEDELSMTDRHDHSRLHRGLRTRETAYFKPILQVLQQLGGTAKTNEVLSRVQKVMKGTLQEVDYEPLASDPEVPRWWNTAQWAHHSMVQAGLLKGDSPRGTWEITEAGLKLISEFES